METIVCKVGGSEGIDYDAVCDDVARLVHDGVPVVLVHGGSAETNRVAEALGVPPRFVTSPSGFQSRHTDAAALEVFQMVYCGKQNKSLVERLQRRGVNAVGLSGMDGGLWRGTRKAAIRSVEDGRVRILRDSRTGTVETVNTSLLSSLMAQGLTPVLTPPALSHEGEAINVDGDRAAAITAAALRARTLLLLSNVPGFLEDFPDESSLVPRLEATELEGAIERAEGRMKIKLLGAGEALRGGVPRVVLGDARSAEPVLRALEGQGTTLVGGAA